MNLEEHPAIPSLERPDAQMSETLVRQVFMQMEKWMTEPLSKKWKHFLGCQTHCNGVNRSSVELLKHSHNCGLIDNQTCFRMVQNLHDYITLPT